MTEGVVDELTEGLKSEFVHDAGAVGFDGLDADAEPCRNIFVALSGCQKKHHFFLAIRQTVVGEPWCRPVQIGIEQQA